MFDEYKNIQCARGTNLFINYGIISLILYSLRININDRNLFAILQFSKFRKVFNFNIGLKIKNYYIVTYLIPNLSIL